MKRLDLTLLLAAGLAVPFSVSAQETPDAVFRVAGLQVTNLLPSVKAVKVACSATTNASDSSGIVYSGGTVFTPVPLADPSLGWGVIRGPFEVKTSRMQPNAVATRWACRLWFSATTSSAGEAAREGCTPTDAASAPQVCPKDGVSVVTFHQGNY